MGEKSLEPNCFKNMKCYTNEESMDDHSHFQVVFKGTKCPHCCAS